MSPIRLGISSCLLGEEVRYDGSHKHEPDLVDALSEFVTFVPVCPEVEVGMGVPRESIELKRGFDGEIRLLGVSSREDHTARMREFARGRIDALREAGLSGYIFKKNSPSCGLFEVKVHIEEESRISREGRGLFAAELTAAMPLLPVEEEGRLRTGRFRDLFFQSVFSYRRLCNVFAPGWQAAAVVDFHSCEKMLLLSHDVEKYRCLGRLVATWKERSPEEFAADYQRQFMDLLRIPSTRKKHTNVLQHLAGHFKKHLGSEEKQVLLETIHEYRNGGVPWVVPATLIRLHANRHGVAWVEQQSYLEPFPQALRYGVFG